MTAKEENYYSVGKVSKLCNIPIRTLHYYNDIGLLKPRRVDPFTGYRYYSGEQLSDINIIKHFKKAGFSLKEILKLFERNDLEYNERMLRGKCLELDNTIKELTILKNRLQLYTDASIRKRPQDQESFPVTVKEIPVSTVAYSRYKGPCTGEEFSLRYIKLCNLIEKNNLQMAGTMMAVFYDDYRNFDYGNADIEVCITVAKEEEKEGVTRRFGGFLAACVMHYGSYATMNHTYAKALEWLDKNGFTFVGGAIENYIIDVITSVYEDDYVTEIILPIRENSRP